MKEIKIENPPEKVGVFPKRGDVFYTWDEVSKMVKAFQERYKISPCDGLPYHPKGIRIILSGEIEK